MSAMSLNAAVTVDRIEPTNWYVGMKDASLQLMVYGKDVRNAEVEVNYPGVRIDSIARLDSPNYLLVYLNLEGAKAGEMTLSFKQGKQTKKVKYELKDRAMAGDKRIGFSNEDVLYMLMPDRYPYADRDGMALWMKTLDREYPNFNTVGETWVTEPAYTAAWQKDSKLSDKNSYLKTVMDFAFFDRINQAKREETDDWWNGMNRIYNVLCYDYLYPNPKSVMAFVENHDTDRFLGDGKDTLALKQALALLLTINRTPQLYYGTEVLMNGTKSVTDGNVRKDFPGGWADDKQNAFTAEGRTKAQNDMFRWTSRLLHWRQGNEVITKGTQTQFCTHKGIYVVARQYKGKSVMTVINGKKEAAELDVKRYAEIIGDAQKAVDVTTGCNVVISHNVKLRPRQTMVLEF